MAWFLVSHSDSTASNGKVLTLSLYPDPSELGHMPYPVQL